MPCRVTTASSTDARPPTAVKVVITGANSAVGLAILRCGAAQEAGGTLVAAVRSDRAAEELRRLGSTNGSVRIAYDDPRSLGAAFQGAFAVVHLPGVLVERPGSSYQQANVDTARRVVEAARASGVSKVVLVSAVGAATGSPNRYLRSKGEAEACVRSSGLGYTVLRAPVLLGPGTEASAALKRNTSGSTAWLIGGGRNLQQPLDVDDLARGAIAASLGSRAPNRVLDVVGPVAVPEREIVERAARLLNRSVRIRSIPKGWVALGAALGRLTGAPGLSRDALDVITADTRCDPQPAAGALGIELTGLDDMIRRSLAGFTRDRFA